MGTNDFNGGVPIGEWFMETEEQVMAARGQTQKLETRKKRTPIMDGSTYKGRINIGINRLKQLLTSSTCHPKLIGEQWSDSLVPFHNHCFAYNILIER